jgi:uncharacterized HAD superfamily protein
MFSSNHHDLPQNAKDLSAMSSLSKESTTPPVLGLDLDGVITDAPTFFSAWTHSWPGEVIVVTYRKDRGKAIEDLEQRNIRFDEVVLVDRFEAKAEVIREKQITIYIDDQPEMLKHIPDGVHVMLFRNEGNYDFEDRRWILSDQTGKLLM